MIPVDVELTLLALLGGTAGRSQPELWSRLYRGTRAREDGCEGTAREGGGIGDRDATPVSC